MTKSEIEQAADAARAELARVQAECERLRRRNDELCDRLGTQASVLAYTKLQAQLAAAEGKLPYYANLLRGDKRDTCVYLVNGEKVVLMRDGQRAWLEIVPQATIRLAAQSEEGT